MVTLEQLTSLIKKNNKNANLELVERSYLFAEEAHENQRRYSGEPYISHPLEVAYILAELNMDVYAICAGILHDVVEDTFITVDVIQINFGNDIAALVDGVTKIGKIQFVNKEQRQAESLRKMIIAMAQDIRVVIVKLADRLHNMRTLSAMREEKQKEKARETLDIYAPLAHRLGISKIKVELEDLALRYLDEEMYYTIAEKVALRKKEREAFIDDVKQRLDEKLKSAGIDAKIEGRAKHFYSIYKKMQKGKDFEEIYDLFAIRALVNTVKDCYGVLGFAHTLWNPLPGRFKDYIATPKPNMYQSLHTTVFGKGAEPFEIQIRTYEMHRTAEYGIAAHWKYKEGKSGASDNFEQKLTWIRELMEFEKELNNSDEFMETVKTDLFDDEVFVFTPHSKVIQLPNGACPLDFAYRIHSDIGNRCVGAKVNGKMVPITYKLQNGDIVEIITNPNSKGPSRDWLNIVVSSHAKNKIKTFFKKLDREENIIRGKEALEKEAKKSSIAFNKIVNNARLDFVKKRFNVKSWDDLFSAIGYGGIKSGLVFQRIKEHFKDDFDIQEEKEDIKLVKETTNDVSKLINIQGQTDLAVFFSKCCNPVPGDNIVGYITKNRGVSIHRSDCINIANTIEKNRLINVSWNQNTSASEAFRADIRIIANDRDGLVVETSTLINNEGISMSSFSADVDSKGDCIVKVCLNVKNKSQLEQLFKKVKNISGIKRIYRV